MKLLKAAPRRQVLLNDVRVVYTWVLAIIALSTSVGGIIAQTTIGGGFAAVITDSLPIFMTLLVAVAAVLLLGQGRSRLALTLLMLVFGLAMVFVPVFVTFLIGVICLIGAAIYPGNLAYVLVNLVVFGRLGYELSQIVEVNGLAFVPEGGTLVLEMSSLIVLSVSLRFLMTTAERASIEAQRAADLLNASADIGQILAQILELRQLFPRAVDLIRDRFGYYHVQIFMIDEAGDYAELVASTGDTGEKLLARGHKLAVGSRSVIGRVTQIGTPVVASNTDSDPVHRRNELLPNTRSELALPIVDGDRILGALDVQSTRSNVFTPTDIQALLVMANQLATIIRIARLFEQESNASRENMRLLMESETRLREIQRLNRQLTREAWERYLSVNQQSSGVMFSPDGVVPGAEWTASMTEAAQHQRIVYHPERDVIAVPILLRGEVLGAIEVTPGQEIRPDDTLEMVQAVAQRLAVSLDNARLFEESQEATYQEQRINEIVARYQTVMSVDELLQFTLAELSESLGAERGAIRLGGLSDAVPRPQNGHHRTGPLSSASSNTGNTGSSTGGGV